jgi:hypothetical protein
MDPLEVDGIEDLVDELRRLDERISELAYERLRAAVADDDETGQADERRLQQAHRALQRALHALGDDRAD